MKKLLFSSLLISSLATVAQGAELTVDVTGIEDIDGNLHVAVYDSAAAMKKIELAYQRTIKQINATDSKLTFHDIEPGEYAVMIYQDMDGNGQLNKNLIGIPKEPFGLSNNPRLMGPPKFKKLSFLIGEENTAISIEMK